MGVRGKEEEEERGEVMWGSFLLVLWVDYYVFNPLP